MDSFDPLDDEFPLGDGEAEGVAEVYCPYCGELSDLLLDTGGGARQEYVEDCPVCCRPWHVVVQWDSEGHARVEVRAEHES